LALGQVVNLAFQVLDPIEDLDQGLVFPAAVSAGEPRTGQGFVCRECDILGWLGLPVVALEAELLACAALGALLVASLLTTSARIAGLALVKCQTSSEALLLLLQSVLGRDGPERLLLLFPS
jgi:hypothetical protein